MIKRYQGNSGRFVIIEEEDKVDRGRAVHERAAESKAPQREKRAEPGHGGGKGHGTPQQGGIMPNILSQLGRILPGGGKRAALETEDIILLLILYLMYRESGDNELLMMMGAMFLL